MNYTKNYRLPQWVKEDRIMMDDFNAAMNSMESGMTKTAAQASAARADASEAKQTADTAKLTADAAFSPSKMPYAVGSYVGKGNEEQTIVVGFQPSVVLIFANQSATDVSLVAGQFSAAGHIVNSGKVTMVSNGFRLASMSSGSKYPYVNGTGNTYQYIAFK